MGILALLVAAVPAARADDDDWEDRHEDYREAIKEQREEDEERWEEWREDREEALEDLHEDGFVPRHGYYGPHHRYRFYDDSYVRHYGPIYGTRYWNGPRTYRYYERYPYVTRYGGHVQAGPADVHYGRHGAVRVGPVHVTW